MAGGKRKVRVLRIVLGDQLDREHPWWGEHSPEEDLIWMAEVREESEHVPSHRQRIALFLSAMRHFREWAEGRGWKVDYRRLEEKGNSQSLSGELGRALDRYEVERVEIVWPGEYRVGKALADLVRERGIVWKVHPDTHFYSTPGDFKKHAEGRKTLRMEFFYREMRKRHDILMEGGGPMGGKWNYDSENRRSFGKEGPGEVPDRLVCEPDKITREVLELVEREFPNHPGSLESFGWPVTPDDAEAVLEKFLEERLENFGPYQDALWKGEPWLYHSHLSAALNLKLIGARRVVEAALERLAPDHGNLSSIEGFVRQILGWREYVRGIYWMHMPGYLERNALGAGEPLPEFYWTGKTSMACLRDAIGQTLEHGYAHHIQRLMVTGLYSLLLGVDPVKVHEWYLSVYVDAVEWVELPNTLGMSQYGDGGLMASKPYVATGKYLQRMGNYCAGCRFDPAVSEGENACPFTTLYWDFLLRHEEQLSSNPRMTMQLRNLNRVGDKWRDRIRERADWIRRHPEVGEVEG